MSSCLSHSVVTLSLFLVLGSAVTACKGSDDGDTTDGASGTGGVAGSSSSGGTQSASGGASSSGKTSSSGGSSSTSSGGGTSGTARHWGQVLFNSTSVGTPLVTLALFHSTSASECAKVTYGDCTFTPTCGSSTVLLNDSAGLITITSPTDSSISLSAQPSGSNTYSFVGTGFSNFVGGETIHVAASGATVPAFTADVTVGLVLLVDSPTPDTDGVISATTTSDLVLTYTRGAAGVVLHAQASSGNGSLTCAVDSTTGTLTIPAGALTALGAGSTIPLWTFTKQDVTAGDYSIVVGSVMNAYTTDRSKAVSVAVN